MKSILEYSDYRKFLRDHAKLKRRKNIRWSIGLWSRKLMLGSTTSLNMILNGQRNPGPSQDRIRSLLTNDLKKLSLGKQSKKPRHIDQRTFLKISNWCCYVIRQMTLLRDFSEDPDSIAARMIFPTSPLEVETAIDSLLKVGLLRKSKDGRLRRVSKFVKTDDDIANEGLKRFHEAMIGHGLKAIRKIDVHEREITGLTLAIKRSQIGEAKELIRRFIQEFNRLGGHRDSDQVSQLNIQFFPLTK